MSHAAGGRGQNQTAGSGPFRAAMSDLQMSLTYSDDVAGNPFVEGRRTNDLLISLGRQIGQLGRGDFPGGVLGQLTAPCEWP